MIKVEITEGKVYRSTGKEGESPKLIPIGEVLEFKDRDEVPGWLVGKCKVVGNTKDKSMQTGEPVIETLRAKFEELAEKKAPKTWGEDKLKAAIAEFGDGGNDNS